MPTVKFIERLYSEQNISFPDGHYLEVISKWHIFNCPESEESTCMVFYLRVIEGAKDHTNCPVQF